MHNEHVDQSVLDALRAQLRAAQAENERLREALTALEELCRVAEAGRAEAVNWESVGNIARAALA